MDDSTELLANQKEKANLFLGQEDIMKLSTSVPTPTMPQSIQSRKSKRPPMTSKKAAWAGGMFERANASCPDLVIQFDLAEEEEKPGSK